jgi:hypothetical protein
VGARHGYFPRLGERFNIDTWGDVHELAVGEIRTFTGGWTAVCRTTVN